MKIKAWKIKTRNCEILKRKMGNLKPVFKANFRKRNEFRNEFKKNGD